MENLHENELENTLNEHFNWNKSRIGCLVKFIFGLFISRTANLSDIATTFSGKAKTESCYKRLQRFLIWVSKLEIYKIKLAKFILSHIKDEKLIISIDRTNWKFGSSHINIFVIAVFYKGISIPLYWMNLNKAGNTNTKTRIECINKLISIITVKRIKIILADRAGRFHLNCIDIHKAHRSKELQFTPYQKKERVTLKSDHRRIASH